MTASPDRAAADSPLLCGLDHVVVAVRDLDAAVAAYRTVLGRAPAWRAPADGGGAMAERLAAVLEAQGEGLASLAFATGDIDRVHRRLARLGLEPEPIAEGVSVDTATGARRPWRRTRAATARTHGVRLFVMQQPA